MSQTIFTPRSIFNGKLILTQALMIWLAKLPCRQVANSHIGSSSYKCLLKFFTMVVKTLFATIFVFLSQSLYLVA